jgi:hypothetical protein
VGLAPCSVVAMMMLIIDVIITANMLARNLLSVTSCCPAVWPGSFVRAVGEAMRSGYLMIGVEFLSHYPFDNWPLVMDGMQHRARQ